MDEDFKGIGIISHDNPINSAVKKVLFLGLLEAVNMQVGAKLAECLLIPLMQWEWRSATYGGQRQENVLMRKEDLEKKKYNVSDRLSRVGPRREMDIS